MNLHIDVFDRDYETLKNYETFLHQMSPKSELCFFTTEKLLREAVKGKPPDVIFAELDGIPPNNLMNELRQIAPDTRVVLASVSDRLAMDALNAGASGYLIKPVTKEKLQQELERLEHLLLVRVKQIFK